MSSVSVGYEKTAADLAGDEPIARRGGVTAAASYHLSKKWGLYKDQEPTPEDAQPLGGTDPPGH